MTRNITSDVLSGGGGAFVKSEEKRQLVREKTPIVLHEITFAAGQYGPQIVHRIEITNQPGVERLLAWAEGQPREGETETPRRRNARELQADIAANGPGLVVLTTFDSGQANPGYAWGPAPQAEAAETAAGTLASEDPNSDIPF
jgi:hypothetical protein